jgi:hypothetical protein
MNVSAIQINVFLRFVGFGFGAFCLCHLFFSDGFACLWATETNFVSRTNAMNLLEKTVVKDRIPLGH